MRHMNMKRKERRSTRRMMRHGIVAYASIAGQKVECLVTDLNVKGAHLVVRGRIGLPKTLYISLNSHVEPRLAYVRWQRGPHVGIEFAV